MVISTDFDPSDGPILPLDLRPYYFEDSSYRPHSTIPSIRGLITTGNFPIIARTQFLDDHDFPPVSELAVRTPAGIIRCELYKAILEIIGEDGQIYKTRTFVAGAPLPADFPECLLGRDFLKAFKMDYTGAGANNLGKVTLSRPSG